MLVQAELRWKAAVSRDKITDENVKIVVCSYYQGLPDHNLKKIASRVHSHTGHAAFFIYSI